MILAIDHPCVMYMYSDHYKFFLEIPLESQHPISPRVGKFTVNSQKQTDLGFLEERLVSINAWIGIL